MKIEKEFIPYEQALQLKELGFDEPCFGYYYTLDNKKVGLEMYIDVQHQDTYFVQAPLYQQAFRWFRENYKCEFHIECRTHTSVKYYEVFLFDGNKHSMVFGKSLTYEEAELECLKKLIEIVKQHEK